MPKCAIVTGAASGIGFSVAQAFVKAGYQVVLADSNAESGQLAADKTGGYFIESDLSKQSECKNLVEQSVKKFGSVDILVNNAGFQHISPIASFPEDKWQQMLSVMLTAPFLLTKYVWQGMQQKQWGRIVNIASIHGKVASANKVAYISAKHGLIGLTRTSAIEGGAAGITANAICPAYVKTPLVDNQIKAQAQAHNISEHEVIEEIMLKPAAIKKLIEPDEIASMVLYLCSDMASSVTGSSWDIDLGWTAK